MPSRNTADMLARFDRPGPRYTSYPTAVEFTTDFNEQSYREKLSAANRLENVPLSFYVHLPFCEERCLFCGCHVIRTRHKEVAEGYLDYVVKEIDLVARQLPERRRISQMHWGGGTPTYSPLSDLRKLHGAIADRFQFTEDVEMGIEVDPRVTTLDQIAQLRQLGFNRLSLGVQDFSPEVQKAVKRIQSYEITAGLIEAARKEGFHSVNVDLIYGLPYQSLEGFENTLTQVIGIRPDRVAVYSFAYVPWLKPHQKYLPEDKLPPARLKLELFSLAIDAFVSAGYRQIGMDHFALPEDELSLAVEERSLSRNFMGYTVQKTGDMLGFGISAIGDVQGAFIQNGKKLSQYYKALDAGKFPVDRGFNLDADDTVRRHVIAELMCNFYLDIQDVERKFDIVFSEYFAAEMSKLTGRDSPVEHGLLNVTPQSIEVDPGGRLFVRNVCMVFDRYLDPRLRGENPVFSRTV